MPLLAILAITALILILAGLLALYLLSRKRCPIDGSIRCPHCIYDDDPTSKG